MRKCLVCIAAVLLVEGCRLAEQPPQLQDAVQMQEDPARPIRICLVQDLSGSIEQTGIRRMNREALEALVALVQSRSGELAFGLIRETSNRPLERLRIDELPPAAPKMPPEPKNLLMRRSWQEQVEALQQQYEATRKAYEERIAPRVEAFLQRAVAMLQGATAKRTDVCGAIRRCDVFLAEMYPEKADAFMMLITDGLHSVRSSRCPDQLSSKAQVVLVTGGDSAGVVERYGPLRFEAVEAAVEFLRRHKP